MKLCDFSTSKFNQTMQADVARQELNFCKALILSHKKLSFSLLHKPQLLFSRYAVLKKDLTVSYGDDFSNYYYGASPRIDSFTVIDAISGFRFRSVEGLEAFISRHCAEFMLHEDQGAYLLDLAKLILLTVASKYGVVFQQATQLAFLSDGGLSSMTTQDKEKHLVRIHGCPCQEMIDKMQPYRFVNVDGVWQISEDGIGFQDIYANKAHISLLNGEVFYSGVLLKALELRKQQHNFESSGIANYQLVYERSTFATVCAFDDYYVNHPLLTDCKQRLEAFFRCDDACKERLSTQLSQAQLTDEQLLTHANEYMRCSHNVNQIVVSGNIKTSQNEILLGMRAAKNIDGGALYPSVNGNAEVYDENVQFYCNSVYEDLPTVNLAQKRSDLQGEIAREAYGELNMLFARESWSCHGLVISGNLPQAGRDNQKRRCHFSVLFENETTETLDEIQTRFHKAGEAFENKNFAAIVIKYHKTRLHSMLGGIIEFLQRLSQSKEIIESVLLLLLAFISIETFEPSFENISSLLSLLFASIIILTTAITMIQRLAKLLRNAKNTKTIRIYASMSYETICQRLSKTMTMKYHPVAYACVKMHIDNLIHEDLEEASKKRD